MLVWKSQHYLPICIQFARLKRDRVWRDIVSYAHPPDRAKLTQRTIDSIFFPSRSADLNTLEDLESDDLRVHCTHDIVDKSFLYTWQIGRRKKSWHELLLCPACRCFVLYRGRRFVMINMEIAMRWCFLFRINGLLDHYKLPLSYISGANIPISSFDAQLANKYGAK